MKAKVRMVVAALLVTTAASSTLAMARCVLTDVEVKVEVPTDPGIQQIEVDIQNENFNSSSHQMYLRKDDSEVVRPGLIGNSFDVNVTEIDRFNGNDEFPTLRIGCTSGSQIIRYGLARFNILWTVI